VAGIQAGLDSHDRRLTTMRQDRLSLDSEINQIYQSSSNLEEIMRTAVKNMQVLRKDFDAAESDRSAARPADER